MSKKKSLDELKQVRHILQGCTCHRFFFFILPVGTDARQDQTGDILTRLLATMSFGDFPGYELNEINDLDYKNA